MSPRVSVSIGALALTSALSFAAPAHAVSAVVDVSTTVGDLLIDIDSSYFSTGHIYDEGQYDENSTDHETGALWLYDTDSDTSSGFQCVADTATDSEDGDAIVVDCADEVQADAFVGLTMDAQARIFAPSADGIVVTRFLYSITNTTGSDITVSEVHAGADFHDAYGYVATNSGSTVGYTVFAESTDVRWFTLTPADESDDSINMAQPAYGAVWQGVDAERTFSMSGDTDDSDELNIWMDDVVVPAGEAISIVLFSVAYNNTDDATQEEALAEAEAFAAYFANFDGQLTGDLAAGIPADANVINWDTPAELADTGADGTATAVLGASLLAAGAIIVLRRRARA